MNPRAALRVGLAAVFLYAGINSLLNPSEWIGFVPSWIGTLPFLSKEVFLILHAVFELVVGGALLTNLFVRTASLLAAVNLASIIIFYGIDDVTFRDFGLLFASLALFLLTNSRGAVS